MANIDMDKLRSQLIAKFDDPKVKQGLKQQGITNPDQLSKLSNTELETRVSGKMLGIMGINLKDIESK